MANEDNRPGLKEIFPKIPLDKKIIEEETIIPTSDFNIPEFQSPDDSLNQSVEDIQPYFSKKNFIEYEDVKEVIKSYFNPEERPKELSEVASKPLKYGIFYDTANEFMEESKKQRAEKKFANDPNVIKVNSTTYIDVNTNKNLYSNIGKNEIVDQALSGQLETGYSFGQLFSIPLDIATGYAKEYTGIDFQTNFTKKLDEVYEKYKFEDPETFEGEIIKVISEYGLPTSIITKAGANLRKLYKSKIPGISSESKSLRRSVKLAESVGYNAAVFGAIDFIAGNTGDRDLFLEKENEEGLEGKDLALARIRNKLRFGAEGTALGGAGSGLVQLVGKGLPIGLKYLIAKPAAKTYTLGSKAANAVVYNPVSKLLSKSDVVVPGIANLIREGSQYTKETILEPVIRGINFKYSGDLQYLPILKPKFTGELPPYNEWRLFNVTDSSPFKQRLKKLDNFLSYFREEFRSPKSAFALSKIAEARLKGESKTINSYLEDLEARSFNLAKAFENKYKNNTSSESGQNFILNSVEEYIKNQRKLNSLPQELQATSLALKEHYNAMKKTFIGLLPENEIKNELLKINKSYLKKSFSVFTNKEWEPPKEIFDDAVKEGINIIKKNKDMIIAAKEEFPNLPITTALKNYSEIMMKNILRTAKSDVIDPINALKDINKQYLRLNKSILSGEELPLTIRKLLGEENNLKSSVLQTTSNFLTQTINKKLYDEIANIGLKEGWLKTAKGIESNFQKIGKIPGLGLMESKISKLYTDPERAIALSGGKGKFDEWIQKSWYRKLLEGKAAIQFGKTVLSPESQIKNVVTNMGFPLTWGWIGGKASLPDSLKIAFESAYGAGKEFNTPTFIKEVEKLIKLKVLDDNLVAQELQAVIKQLQKEGTNNIDKVLKILDKYSIKAANVFGKNIKQGTISDVFEGSMKSYQGGDNIWRHHSFLYNNSYLTNIFKGDLKKLIQQQELITGEKYNPISIVTGKTKTFSDAVDEFASWYVNTLMPTYSQIPYGVKEIRKLPLGNFISWPAEIIRLTGAGIRTSLREISSDIPEIRQSGLKKLVGMFTTFGGAGYAVTNLAQNLTGVTEDQINAYKRSFAAEYNKNSSLIPYGPIKNNILKVSNFSYSDVFDTVKKPVKVALENLSKANQSLAKGEDYFSFVDNLVRKTMLDSAYEFIKPFVSTSLGVEQVIDVSGTGFGRNGVTKDGRKIYSSTDSFWDASMKSVAHILKTVLPGVATSFDKYTKSIYDTVTGRARPYDLRNKFISTASGSKVEEIDLLKSFESKVFEFSPKIKKEIFSTESFYSPKDWQSNTPQKIQSSFEKMQQEAFQQQKELYQLVKDAKILKISEDVIEDILMKGIKDKKLIRNLLEGEFTPIKYNAKLFDDKYDKIERTEKISGRNAPNYDRIAPLNRLDRVLDRHEGISLKRNYEDAILKRQKNLNRPGSEEIFPIIPTKIENDKQSNIQTPPLPSTPQPVATSNITPQVNPTTKLTSVESALLSPTEQAIRQTQRS
jgi:hypothetical protein